MGWRVIVCCSQKQIRERNKDHQPQEAAKRNAVPIPSAASSGSDWETPTRHMMASTEKKGWCFLKKSYNESSSIRDVVYFGSTGRP